MIEAPTWLRLQRLRHAHDIASGDVERPSPDRLKSRGIELTVALGRMARSRPEAGTPELVREILLGVAGAANLLRVDLSCQGIPACDVVDTLHALAGPVGQFADGCEKIDHLEDFRTPAVAAVLGMADWCAAIADLRIDEAPSGAELRVSPRGQDAAEAPRSAVA